jgi:hypothetical protein
MIVIGSSPVLGPAGTVPDARNPRIGWHNLVRFNNVTADEATDDEPITNIANPATYLLWRGLTTAEQSVQLSLDVAEDVNYFAIAKHNLGSSGAFLSFESSTNGTDWDEVVAPFALNNDTVMIREFDPVTAAYFRLLITPGVVPPSIGVLYIGNILVLQRRLYVGHTPFPYGRKSVVSTGFSESGQFLGRIRRRETFESSIELPNITPEWYRAEMEPFIEVASVTPFFWAWRPGDYPFETGYAWLTGNADVSNLLPNGMMKVSLSMQGIR